MSEPLSVPQAIAAVPGLTHARPEAFIATEVIIPLASDDGPVFRGIEIARLRLLCELSDDLDLEDEAVGIVISLLDQLHAARADLRALARALAAEPPDTRSRIGAALRQRVEPGDQPPVM